MDEQFHLEQKPMSPELQKAIQTCLILKFLIVKLQGDLSINEIPWLKPQFESIMGPSEVSNLKQTDNVKYQIQQVNQ